MIRNRNFHKGIYRCFIIPSIKRALKNDTVFNKMKHIHPRTKRTAQMLAMAA